MKQGLLRCPFGMSEWSMFVAPSNLGCGSIGDDEYKSHR